jgi:squalene-associated FAD-dependent desaturase
VDRKVIIIGGGLAGLSAGITCIKNGLRPILIEKNRYVGGRVRSFYSPDIEKIIDNGQHILSNAYKETFNFLEIIGSLDKVFFQTKFSALMVKKPSEKILFETLPLPSPLHFFLPFLYYRKFIQIQLKDFFKFVFKNKQLSQKNFKKMTVDEWLRFMGQNQSFCRNFWKPLTVSILNTSIENASAYLLYRALQNSFFHSRKTSGMALPKDWLGNLFCTPAEHFILKNGGKIFYLHTVLKLNESHGLIENVVTQKQIFNAQHFISTIPPFALARILKKSDIKIFQKLIPKLQQFRYNPIITINLILEHPIPLFFPLLLLDSPLQWIFPHPDNSNNKYSGYGIVLSDAKELVNLPPNEIMDMLKQEFYRVLGLKLDNRMMVAFKILKEKRATISQTPETLSLKLKIQSPLSNLFWAGDWIDTGFPATIENAILTGRLATESILKNKNL